MLEHIYRFSLHRKEINCSERSTVKKIHILIAVKNIALEYSRKIHPLKLSRLTSAEKFNDVG